MSDRCLGISWECDRLKLGVVCDRCLGMLGCDRLKLGLCAIAFWGCWECDRLKLGWCDRFLGCWVRSFEIRGLCGIAVWDVGRAIV